MIDLVKIFRLVRPYGGWVVFNIFCNIMVALFTVVSIPALIPFLRLLFGLEAEVRRVDTFSAADGLDYLVYQLSVLLEIYGRDKVMLWMCLLLLVVFLMKNTFRYLSMFALAPMRNGVAHDLRSGMFAKLMGLQTAFFSEEKKGNLLARFSTDTTEVEWSILHVLEIFFRAPFILLGSLSYMLYVSPKLTLYVLILVLFVTLLISRISKALKERARLAQKESGQMLSLVEEGISGQKVFKAFRAENFVLMHFNRVSLRLRDMMNQILWRRDLASPLSEFFGVTVLIILLWLGARMVYHEGVDPAFFLTFLFAFYNVIDPAKQLANGIFSVRKGLASLHRIQEILESEIQVFDVPDARTITGFEREITFENVSFNYPGSDKPVLQHLSFSIKKGQKIALVGPSGAGKSTLLDLLPRFRDVTEGRILIDGQDIRSITLESLRSLFGLVTQDPFLFNDTIHKNIAFGLESTSEDEVRAAAQKAFAEEFIIQTENGYDTLVGDGGVKLSGGQKQRITIARAILRDPAIFLLDEATSALDTASEKKVQLALDSAMSNRTSVIIAHRLSTIQNADVILVLQEGKLVESGNHATLMAKGGAYADYIHMQTI
jgi:ABC-type multidrug transport system fused ATPase/permease subunit